MLTKCRTAVMLGCALAASLRASSGHPGEVTPHHLALAEQLVTQLHGVADNHYGGGPRHIDWDASPPTARVVCSSFATLLLEKAYSLTDSDIEKMGAGKNPKAEGYFDAVGKDKAFEKISHFKNLRLGDFLFIKYTDGHVSRNGVEDSGHVMLVASLPERTSKRGDAPVDSEVYTAQVIDSSASGHGPKDTRHIGPNQYTGGVGKGTIRLAVSPSSGRIVAYSWSDQSKSEYFSEPGRVMVAARLNLRFFQSESAPLEVTH